MKKTIAIAAAVTTLTTLTSQADIIKCTFTEPFVDSTYSMTQSTLTYNEAFSSEDGKPRTVVIKNVSFQIKGAGRFELVDKNGKVLQTLRLTGKGSNGMSDQIYPYEVKDSGPVMSPHSANNNYGGCSSNHLKVKDGEY